MLVLKLLFWIAGFCLVTGISAVPAMVVGLLLVLAGGMVDALLGRGRRGRDCNGL